MTGAGLLLVILNSPLTVAGNLRGRIAQTEICGASEWLFAGVPLPYSRGSAGEFRFSTLSRDCKGAVRLVSFSSPSVKELM